VGGPGIALGFLRFNARYTVRGRRGTVLSAQLRISMMTASEQEEALEYLLEERRAKEKVSRMSADLAIMKSAR
jgi:hypothetical protein